MIRRVKTCHKLVTWGTSRRHFWAPKNQEAPLHLYSEGFILKWRLSRLGRGVRNRNSQNTGIAGMGGSDPCLDFCEGFVHMHWGPSKVIIHHPKVIISPQKCPFFPQKPHLFNIFTLKNDLRTFVENCRESHLRDIMGQIAQDAWIRGWGGGVNLIQAMPEFWEHLDRPPLP